MSLPNSGPSCNDRSGLVVAVMDWASRCVLSWRLSNTMESGFCVEALEAALATGTPGIFNTDQGAQFTSTAFTDGVRAAGAACSMDGRVRCLDNVFIERLWRSLKYEAVLQEPAENRRPITVAQHREQVVPFARCCAAVLRAPALRCRSIQAGLCQPAGRQSAR